MEQQRKKELKNNANTQTTIQKLDYYYCYYGEYKAWQSVND